MRVTQYRWFLLGLLVVWIIGLVKISDESNTYGISLQWVNGQYRFAGGTHPIALCLAALAVGSYVLLFLTDLNDSGKPVPGVFRRFVAFWIDFALCVVAIASMVGIVPMLMEWSRTGNFQWVFERDVPASGDLLQATVAALVVFASLVFYHVLPLLNGRPTPGACVMGYRVVPDEGTRLTRKQAVLRTLMGFLALCGYPFTAVLGRDKRNGKFWLDKKFSTHAITLQ